jgi:hypothetical protein
VTQLFDQMAVPDPAALPRPIDVRLEMEELFSIPDTAEVDLTPFFALPPPRPASPRTPAGTWLRAKGPGVLLVVAGAALGVAAARL